MDWTTVAGTVVSILALVVAGVSLVRQKRHEVKMTSLTAMVPYTEKYERIMDLLSDEQRGRGFWGLTAAEAQDPKVMRAFLQYCNLCSEEFHLAKGVLEAELWQIWKDEMRIVFQSPFGQMAWAKVKESRHFVSHGVFERQVDAWVRDAPTAFTEPSVTSMPLVRSGAA